jgi:hypothetical protein
LVGRAFRMRRIPDTSPLGAAMMATLG